MVVLSLKKQCEEKGEFSTADGDSKKKKEMEAEKRTKNNNRSPKGKNGKNEGKKAEAAAEEEKPAVTQRRTSARLQSKQWEEKKQLLVRKRVELLAEKEEEDEEEEEEEEEGEGSFNKRTKTKYAYSRRVRINVENAGADLYKEAGEEIKVESGEGLRSGNVGHNGGLGGAEPTNGSSAGAIDGGGRAPGVGNRGEKSAYGRVKDTLRLFNKHYLHFVQEEEKRCSAAAVNKKAAKNGSKGSKSKKEDTAENDTKKKAKRPDLKAVSKMMENNEIMYPEKRFGDLPGVDVGHQFYSRCEMVAVGFHSHWLNGIDYMGQFYKKGNLQDYSNYTFPLAVAIVLSGMYEDDLDNAEDVIYTGQGGHNLTGNKRQIRDQVLERGNLALKNSVEQCVPVRVIRGHESASSYSGKVYTYDGLYKVVQYWAEKGISGFTVFKYRLRRMEGQPVLTTNQVHFSYGRVPQSVSEIRGLVCEDISGGQEMVPIPATNLVDDPPVAPSGYTYKKSIQVSKNVKIPLAGVGCNCKGTCVDPRSCACARLNGGDFPYVHRDGGRLIEPKDVVFECGPNCGCGPGCVNRTSQRGLKYRLEVFRTPKKGWAVRSWDFIPSGAPVCEYIGVLRKTEDVDNFSGNDYIFDIDCEQTMRGLDGRMKRRLRDVAIPTIDNFDNGDDQKSESVPEFCIDAGHLGNIARFINHSCEPNLFVQCVLSSHQDLKLARVLLFAADNIPPLQELTYDYGYALDSVCGPDGNIKRLACYCGVADCRKRLY